MCFEYRQVLLSEATVPTIGLESAHYLRRRQRQLSISQVLSSTLQVAGKSFPRNLRAIGCCCSSPLVHIPQLNNLIT
jgi:hypothetical protein